MKLYQNGGVVIYAMVCDSIPDETFVSYNPLKKINRITFLMLIEHGNHTLKDLDTWIV